VKLLDKFDISLFDLLLGGRRSHIQYLVVIFIHPVLQKISNQLFSLNIKRSFSAYNNTLYVTSSFRVNANKINVLYNIWEVCSPIRSTICTQNKCFHFLQRQFRGLLTTFLLISRIAGFQAVKPHLLPPPIHR
jgi:hypothetical protein